MNTIVVPVRMDLSAYYQANDLEQKQYLEQDLWGGGQLRSHQVGSALAGCRYALVTAPAALLP